LREFFVKMGLLITKKYNTMATATCFEELEVWKLSMNLTVDVYKHFKECKD